MRRTLTVLVASAALLVPATAAQAAKPVSDGVAKTKTNASCNSGFQRGPDGFGYNGAGNYAVAIVGVGCGTQEPLPLPWPEPKPEPECDTIQDPSCEQLG